MAGDDPKSSALEDNKDEESYSDSIDGFGRFRDEDLQNVMADPNPNLMDMYPSVFPTIPIDIDQTQLLHELDLSITDYDTNDEFDGLSFVDDEFTISWDMFKQSTDNLNENINNDVPGEIGNDNSNNNGCETSRLEVSTRVFGDANGPNFEIGGTSTMCVPVTSTISDGSFVCTCCKMLRELVHIKDGVMNTLNIYGGIGFFCHAILLIQRFGSDYMESQPQIFYLKDLTMEEIKKFIEDYCSQKVASGSSLVQDTNAAFYQAIGANSIFNQSPFMLTIPSRSDVPMSLASPKEALDVSPVPLHVGLREEPTTGVPKEKGKRKTPLAAQRERTAKLTLKDLSMYFHLPIETAAREMKLCPTVLKKICRNGGLMRWPHRKIKSLQKKNRVKEEFVMQAKDDEEKAIAKAEMESLQSEIDRIFSDALKKMK